jgi:hypothetical protein
MYSANGGWLPQEDLSEATFNGMQYEGVTYGVPLDNHGRGLWINTGAFENAGVDATAAAPTTYEGWVELFQQLTLDANGNNAASADFDPENVAQWGFTVGEWPFVNWYASLAQHGGSLLTQRPTAKEAANVPFGDRLTLLFTRSLSDGQARRLLEVARPQHAGRRLDVHGLEVRHARLTGVGERPKDSTRDGGI